MSIAFSPGSSTVREQLGIPHYVPVIGFAGRLTRDKGLPELCEAFDLILCAEPSARLLLVGWFDVAEDALDSGLRERILHHPQIYCTGFVPDTAPYYRAMDLLFCPPGVRVSRMLCWKRQLLDSPSSPRRVPARAILCFLKSRD